MLKLREYLEEKLKIMDPKDPAFRFVRDNYKHWDKEKYKELFLWFKNKPGYELDKNAYRLYFPLKKKTIVQPPNNKVTDFIESKGFQIIDYHRGIITKLDLKGKLVTNNLQSILSKYKQSELEKDYVKDPHHVEAKSNSDDVDDYWIVISRHPYDIIGMSTDRDWISCMNLRSENSRKYLPMDIKQGTLVAYLISTTDKNIQSPLARVSIRPYIGNKESDIVFGVSNKVYGDLASLRSTFSKRVVEWVDIVHNKQDLNGIFNIKPGLYDTESDKTISKIKFKSEKDNNDYNEINGNNLAPSEFKKINPSDSVLKVLLKDFKNSKILKFLDNPSGEYIDLVIDAFLNSKTADSITRSYDFIKELRQYKLTPNQIIKTLDIDLNFLYYYIKNFKEFNLNQNMEMWKFVISQNIIYAVYDFVDITLTEKLNVDYEKIFKDDIDKVKKALMSESADKIKSLIEKIPEKYRKDYEDLIK